MNNASLPGDGDGDGGKEGKKGREAVGGFFREGLEAPFVRSFVGVSFATAVCADRVQNVAGGYIPAGEAESHPFSLIFLASQAEVISC